MIGRLTGILLLISANRKLQRVASAVLHLLPPIGRLLRAQHVRGGGRGKLPQVQGVSGEGRKGQESCKKGQKDGKETQKYGQPQL